ncbi:P-selectin-like [Tropilaelaps mercedesae]|uniref:p-selectin-like n=1 Tax=Tropilaelaps mercedesae TaxID=418985 RepID=A0A1V9XE78_9ACAR|nr:P-selectin-like [Tropilaelaps mercedesae]
MFYQSGSKAEASSPTESPDAAPTDPDYVGTLQFPHGTEVVFDCIEASSGGERNTWKLLCDDGNWIGRPEKCDLGNSAIPKELRANMSCYYQLSEPHLLAFDGDRPLAAEEMREFLPGSTLTFRCADIGKYALIGSGSRACEYGEWTGVKSSCIGLSQEHDYALEKPPTILFRHSLGPVAQSTDGKLIVWEGTILHLECLWLRKYGTPKWEASISHQNRRYAEGWTTEPGRDSQLEYRLSIYHAREDDSGRYTCVTPMGHKHTVEIVVKSVTCPPLFNGSSESSLTLRSSKLSGAATTGSGPIGVPLISQNDTRMGAVVAFSCPEGQNLVGEAEVECLPSGRWSENVPTCKVAVPCTVTECRDLSKLDSDLLIIDVLSSAVGAKATFSCPQGYGLRGEFEAECLESGFWSADIPHCRPVSCQPLEPPEDGYILGAGAETGAGEARVFRGGDLIQFSCNTDFMMIGTGIVVCQENERWSAPVPKCVPACQYPPVGESGARIVSRVSYFYRINETVTFECPQGKVLRGAGIIKCVSKGHWSAPVPSCLDAQGQAALSGSQSGQSVLTTLQAQLTPSGTPSFVSSSSNGPNQRKESKDSSTSK